jgi:hypothetical protein
MAFYTYIYYDEDWFPYYVGKGMGDRFLRKHGSIVVPPRDHILIQYRDSEALAFEAEKVLILLFGRLNLNTGNLMNEGEGGRGVPHHACIKGGRKNIENWGTKNLVHVGNTYAVGNTFVQGMHWSGCRNIPLTSEHQRDACRGANHNRWHVRRGIIKEGCALCQPL